MAKEQKVSQAYLKIQKDITAGIRNKANDETTYGGFSTLPGGIRNGIAQLISVSIQDIKTGDNAGKAMCRMVGVIVSPKSVVDKGNIVIVKGEQTSQMFNLFEKRSNKEVITLEDQIGKILNEFRKLGYDTAENIDKDLIEMADDLVEMAPFFKFSTDETEETLNPDGSVKFKSRVFENWNGCKGLEDYSPEDTGDMVDNTAPPPVAKSTDKNGKAPAPTKAPEPDDTFDLDQDLDSLAVRADSKNEEKAMGLLTEFARNAGIKEATIKAVDSWADLVDMIRAAGDKGEPSGPAFDEGDEVMVQLKDDKTKKLLPAVAGKVLHYHEDEEALDLKVGKNIHKKVPQKNVTKK